MQNAAMGTTITIRNVSKETHDELVARAARAGQSLQEYLKHELMKMAEKPDIETWLARVRKHKATYGGIRLTAEEILDARGRDRT